MSAAPTRGRKAERKTTPSRSRVSHSEPSSTARRRRLREEGGAEVAMAPTRALVLKAEARAPVQRRGWMRRGEEQAMDDGRLFLQGEWVETPRTAAVHAPWDGRLLSRVAQASAEQAE